MVIHVLHMGNELWLDFQKGPYSSFTGVMMIFTKFFESFEQLYTEVLHENEQSTLVVERSKKKYGSSSTSSTATGTTAITTL